MGNENSISNEPTENGIIPEKHENGSANGISANITSDGLGIDVKSETMVQHNCEPLSLSLATESSEPDSNVVKSDSEPAEAQVISEAPEPTTQKEDTKKKRERVKLFGKVFKKKPAGVTSDQGKETSNEDQTTATGTKPETADLQQTSESLTEPESVTLDLSPEGEKAPESDNGNDQPVENREECEPEENPVMNFFKTLVAPTKTSKKETATPDATKEQSQKETQPAATTTVAQLSEPPAAPKGMPAPPPPPPEPTKVEIRGEPAAKPAKPVPKEEPKATAKEPESSKAKSAKDSLSKLFRSKCEKKVEPQEIAKELAQAIVETQVVDGLPQPVVEAEKKVDPSKTRTLEAAAKPELPPPVQEEKQPTSKTPFLSFFKPKVLLDHMTAKLQATSTSGVRLLRRTTGVAPEPKKATSAPAAAAEAAQAGKPKEEPKTAAKSSEAVVDSKQTTVASQAGDNGASVSRKLEKRNSIHLFFKNLGQKRPSIDAGVQTEPVAVAPAAEKTK
ncbi:breast carcinoma-amplified sequence 1 isoform X4 [Channa argus]|uniref:breast carcinoma-amplified sequence 1 isoform X4 n=1 Tax=Channa argus TaxID=215402 RepID=UPI0035209A36